MFRQYLKDRFPNSEAPKIFLWYLDYFNSGARRVALSFPIMERIFRPKKLDILVTSYGGSGTSALLEFLNKHHAHINTNHPFNKDACKHSLSAVANLKPSGRVLYLFSDPKLAILSVYRRDMLPVHDLSMRVNFKWIPCPIKTTMDLKTYLAKGKDPCTFERYFDAWLNLRLPQPILFMRYETLWDNLEVLFDFLGLPPAVKNDFPKFSGRLTSVEDFPLGVQTQIDSIYEDFSKRISTLPDYFLHSYKRWLLKIFSP